MTSKTIAQGAEAIITLNDNKITKNRIKKSYRIKEIDERLRKSRTRSEAKIMNKLKEIIPVPKIIKTDEKQEIIMEFIDGKKISDNLESLDYKDISKIIGETTALVHNQNIIHGDLTTSNMIYVENHIGKNKLSKDSLDVSTNQSTDSKINDIKNKTARKVSKRNVKSNINQNHENESANSEGKVFLIDFGLAFHSQKIEDKAVDLHLLQQALEAKHFTIWQECFEIILQNYEKTALQAKEIIQRIKVIESRGRYREKF